MTEVGNVVVGLLALIAAVIGCFVLVPRWIHVPASVAGTFNSPAMMPRDYFIALGALGAILAYQGFTRMKFLKDEVPIATADWQRVAVMLVLCALYLLGIELVGLPIASALALSAAMLVFGERRPVAISLTAVLVPLLLWAFFTKVAGVPMPDSIFEIGGFMDFEINGGRLLS